MIRSFNFLFFAITLILSESNCTKNRMDSLLYYPNFISPGEYETIALANGCDTFIVEDRSFIPLDESLLLNHMDNHLHSFKKNIFIIERYEPEYIIDSVFHFSNQQDTLFFFKNRYRNLLVYLRLNLKSDLCRQIRLNERMNELFDLFLIQGKCYAMSNVEQSDCIYFNTSAAGDKYLIYDSFYLNAQINWEDMKIAK